MASVCMNNIGMSPEAFPPAYSSYGCFNPRRISFSSDMAGDGTVVAKESQTLAESSGNSPDKPDSETSGQDLLDFEFRLDDSVTTMLPADELFSDGKLVPLQLSTVRSPVESTGEICSQEAIKERRRAEIAGSETYALSPKAPRCSSRWKELLGLKRTQSPKPELQKADSVPSKNTNPKSLKHFLHRNPKSSSDSSLSLPLLRDSDSESVSISSRLSLPSSSSSSSGPDHEHLPRFSLDADKPIQISLSGSRNPPRARVSKPRTEGHMTARTERSPIRRPPEMAEIPTSADSPRMNSSGKIVFQGLGRSSSSPSTLNGGPRSKQRGMERSYSANVRVTPVLNVPVCSLRRSSKSVSVFGFGQLFTAQRKEREGLATIGRCSSSSKSKIERA